MNFPKEYKTLLKNLLITEDLQTVFQPIFDVDNNVPLGFEALTRGPKNHPLQFPNVLFEVAHIHGLLSELELLCRKLAFKRFSKLNLSGKLY